MMRVMRVVRLQRGSAVNLAARLLGRTRERATTVRVMGAGGRTVILLQDMEGRSGTGTVGTLALALRRRVRETAHELLDKSIGGRVLGRVRVGERVGIGHVARVLHLNKRIPL
jgi:hypothetical protein